jgi:hypothetical protein
LPDYRECPNIGSLLTVVCVPADPHNERIWEEPSDADESTLLVSREYVDGSVAWRLCRVRALIGE